METRTRVGPGTFHAGLWLNNSPRGDGNLWSLSPAQSLLLRQLWLNNSPRGDGNPETIGRSDVMERRLWLNNSPRGDGNTSICLDLCKVTVLWLNNSPRGDGNQGHQQPKQPNQSLAKQFPARGWKLLNAL